MNKELTINFNDIDDLLEQVENIVEDISTHRTSGAVGNSDHELILEWELQDNSKVFDLQYFQEYTRKNFYADDSVKEEIQEDIEAYGINSQYVAKVNIAITDYYNPNYDCVSYTVESIILNDGTEIEYDDYGDMDPYTSRNDYYSATGDYGQISDDVINNLKVEITTRSSDDS